ncbi:base excision DNA repair protein [Cercophora scortea]|uniref:Base excision DNA repair protein n=1 Tax=Cercophora scortea TaxID=314031 RepID=A0AAE0IWH3_9PEZI|nr:base excision DNA repair protein [Cercophora scortea]
MAKSTRKTSTAAAAQTSTRSTRSTTRKSTKAEPSSAIKQEPPATPPRSSARKRPASPPSTPQSSTKKKPKLEDSTDLSPLNLLATPLKPTTSTTTNSTTLQSRKLKSYTQHGALQSPFPTFPHPTPAACKKAHRILAAMHGARPRPQTVTASATRAGCGDAPSVLDALVRTILSQNTSDVNSARAKRSMDAVYGRSDAWASIAGGGQAKLQAAIKCGGLSAVKSRVIMSILEQVYDRYGGYTLEHLRGVSSAQAMEEMLSFKGVGPKTASCVLLFCLGRESFAVDTHVWRISGLLGWRPAGASRDQTHLHLDARVPDEDKYGLHVLLVTHGKRCGECKAGGRSVGKCELRRAFRGVKEEKGEGGVRKGEEGKDGVKKEEMEEEKDVKTKVEVED